MSAHHHNALRVLRRFLLAVPFFALAVYLFLQAGGSADLPILIFGMASMLTGSIIMAPSIAVFVTEPLGAIFFPQERFRHPPPVYSIPEARAKVGRYEEAMALYETIAMTHPDEVKPYLDMIEIAVNRLGDPVRGEKIYAAGMERLASKKAQAILKSVYEAIAADQGPRPPWDQHDTIAYKPR